jgi:hypothetical protein
MPWYEQSGGFHGSAAVNRRLGSPLARGDGELPLLNSFKGAIFFETAEIWRMSGYCRWPGMRRRRR